jgi:hypothetical protein
MYSPVADLYRRPIGYGLTAAEEDAQIRAVATGVGATTGAVFGGVVGVLAGGVIGLLASPKHPDRGAATGAVAGGLLLGIAGAVLLGSAVSSTAASMQRA